MAERAAPAAPPGTATARLSAGLAAADEAAFREFHALYFDRLYGLYKLHPELKGQGDEAIIKGEAYKFAKRDIPVICATQPRWETILTEMLEALGEQAAPEVSVWLSEFAGQCQCAECRKSTQVQSESRLVTAAWQEARKKYPKWSPALETR